MLRLHDAANARELTIIARAVQSSANGRSCRSASVDWIVPPARQADDPRQARLRSRGRGSCRSQRKEYAHKPNDKVTANRHAAADLRSALPAPLPTSASDWMHAHSCFPQCSRTNAATPPLIVSPIVSPDPSQSRDHAGAASRAVAHARVAWVAPNVRVLALVRVRSAPGCSGVVGDRSPAKAAPIRGHKSTRLAHALPDSVPCASSSSSLPIPPFGSRGRTARTTVRAIGRDEATETVGNARRGNATTGPAIKTSDRLSPRGARQRRQWHPSWGRELPQGQLRPD